MQIVQTSREDVTTIHVLNDFSINSPRDLCAAIEKARTTSCRTILRTSPPMIQGYLLPA